jgi:hypothetical protein
MRKVILLGIGAVLVIVGSVVVSHYASIAQLKRDQRERWQRQIAAVKSGRSNAVVEDGELLELLVDDSDCRLAVSSIDFVMADLADSKFQRIREFPKLRKVFFYSCENVEEVLVLGNELNSVEELAFETSHLYDESINAIPTFPNLKVVHFEQIMADETIEKLKGKIPGASVSAPFLQSAELQQ